jgi:hypothetical protein
MSIVEQLEDTSTDQIVRAVTAAVERYRIDLDGDASLSLLRIEVRFYDGLGGTPPRGKELGDVRSVIVQHQSEFRPA